MRTVELPQTLDTQVPHYESSRWRDWCVLRNHAGVTYNPIAGKTWCRCGEVVTVGDALDKRVWWESIYGVGPWFGSHYKHADGVTEFFPITFD